jgi:hypothetical protein
MTSYKASTSRKQPNKTGQEQIRTKENKEEKQNTKLNNNNNIRGNFAQVMTLVTCIRNVHSSKSDWETEYHE